MLQHEKGTECVVLYHVANDCFCTLANLKFVVCVGADYPFTPPAFVIKITGSHEVQDLQIKVRTI